MRRRVLLLTGSGNDAMSNEDRAALRLAFAARDIEMTPFDGKPSFDTAKKAKNWSMSDAYRVWPAYAAHEPLGPHGPKFELVVLFDQPVEERDGLRGFVIGPVNVKVAVTVSLNRPGSVFIFRNGALTVFEPEKLLTFTKRLGDRRGQAHEATFGFYPIGEVTEIQSDEGETDAESDEFESDFDGYTDGVKGDWE